MKRYIYCMAIFAIGVIIFSCNRKANDASVKDIELMSVDTAVLGAFSPPQNENDKQEEKQKENNNKDNHITNDNTSLNDQIDWDKKIIKTADVELQLDDYQKFNSNIHSSLNRFGAYIAQEKQHESDYRIENSITIKVPVALFDNLINSLQGDGVKIINKNISSDDVTSEVVDTKSRLQAKLAVREKYLQLLKQAKNMNEILQVEKEINDIQENIEAANGRIDYLKHASAYSTINVDYYQYVNGSTGEDVKPDFFSKFLNALSNGTSLIGDFVLICITIWPLLLIGIFIWLYYKKLKLKRVPNP